MSFQFEEQNSPRFQGSANSGMIGFLIRVGLVKTKRQAEWILLIFLLIFITIPVVLMWPEPEGVVLTPFEASQAGNPSEITNSY